MTKIIEGKLDATGKSFAIVVSRWNQIIVSKLLEGALDSLKGIMLMKTKLQSYIVRVHLKFHCLYKNLLRQKNMMLLLH